VNQLQQFMRRPGVWRSGLFFAADLIIPTVIFYLALYLGAGLYLALLVSAGWSAVTGLIGWVRGQQRSGARFMLLVALASFAISLVTGSDRFLLARESVITALVGGWFLSSLRDERPMTFRFTRPLWEGRFRTTANWDDLWETSARFRHIWRSSTVMWGAVTLIDAALRVVIAYTFPVDSVPALQTALGIATLLLMQVITNVYYVRAGLWPLLHGAPDRRRPERRTATVESEPQHQSSGTMAHPTRHT
jgi:intracellular septation protein A